MRRAIRDRGLKLLTDLHDVNAYERIIMVAHSLGTVIAYDLVSLLWAERRNALVVRENEPAFEKLRAVEIAAHALAGTTERHRDDRRRAYREAQRTFRLALRSGGADGNARSRRPDEEWLISDLVTLGSPLTHAEFLLSRNPNDLRDKIVRWLFPTNWPQFQKIQSEQRKKIEDRPGRPPPEVFGPPDGLFSYFLASPETWSMHHSAPFSAVRWTNIYDPHRRIFQGDIISGPLASVFGNGILDINLRDLRGQSSVFSHTLYWAITPGRPAPHVEALRKAVDLLDRPDSEIGWENLDRQAPADITRI